MKKTVSYICFLLLFPLITFASWWNPFSWFNYWTFSEPTQITQTDVLENRIKELEKKLQDTSLSNPENSNASSPVSTSTITGNNQETDGISSPKEKQLLTNPQAIKPTSIPTPITPLVPVVTDVCSNIEGVQTTIPSGYTSSSGSCTLVIKKDYCPNIDGVQSEIPDDRTVYRATGECLTDAQIDTIQKKLQESEKCDEAKKLAVDIAKQKQTLLAEYNATVAKIQQNSVGASSDAVASFVQEANTKWSTQDDLLNSQLTTANYEVNQYCD